MANQPTTLTITLPTTNTDGSTVVAGELADIDIGYGPASNGGNGTFAYPTIVESALTAVDPTNVSPFSFAWSVLAQPALPVGVTFIAARVKTSTAAGAKVSNWSTEVQWTVPAEVPAPPGFSVA